MKILAIAKIKPKATLDTLKPLLEAEVKCAWELYKHDKIREMYTRMDQRLGVVFMLECSDMGEARQVLSELPFVREEFIDFDLIPLAPFSFF